MATGNGDEYLTLEEARSLFPGNPPLSRLQRWVREGLFNGALKLEARPVGHKLYTTRGWCEAFDREQLERRKGGKAPETPAAKKRRQAKTSKALDRAGIK